MAGLLSACDSDMPEGTDMEKGAELSFTTSGASRAITAPAFDRFAVFGDMKYQAYDNAVPTVIFDNKEVEYKDGIWTYGNKPQYWFPNHEHSFVAITPVSILGAGSAPLYSDSHLTFTYTIPAPGGNLSGNSDIDDILVATHRRFFKNADITTSLDSKINLKFSHILSQINFTPAFTDNHLSSDDYIQFHKLEFSGISTKALIDILPATMQSNNQTDDMVLGITPQQRGTITLPFTTPVKVENNAINVNLFADNGSILMLPLDFEADSEAKITFYYTVNDDELMRQVSIPLNSQKWE